MDENKVHFRVGSKTFLVGEYAALRKSPAIVINTFPSFELVDDVRRIGSSTLDKVAPQSPAGRWIQQNPRCGQLSFFDPHGGRGGLGASSAQFLLAYAATFPMPENDSKKNWLCDLWKSYRACTDSAASGMDVLGQAIGGIAWVDIKNSDFRTMKWPFEDMEFLILSTGNKVATHEHLAKISARTWDNDQQLQFESCITRVQKSLVSASSTDFANAINDYGQLLQRLDFVLPATASILAALRLVSGVWAAKGCGALGADTVFVFLETSAMDVVRGLVQKTSGLAVVATSKEICGGLTHD